MAFSVPKVPLKTPTNLLLCIVVATVMVRSDRPAAGCGSMRR